LFRGSLGACALEMPAWRVDKKTRSTPSVFNGAKIQAVVATQDGEVVIGKHLSTHFATPNCAWGCDEKKQLVRIFFIKIYRFTHPIRPFSD
ncbi:hypothetical protein, partial [Xanthomonas hortorum]|uniref:hypothetical protein n=1 Tax=Xanthomonas hortorum TaxID=56454 RepID=UPI001C3C7001